MCKCMASQLGVQSTVGGLIRIIYRSYVATGGQKRVHKKAGSGDCSGDMFKTTFFPLCTSFIIKARCDMYRL